MRICLFISTFLPKVGGAEVVVDALANQFHAKGHHAVVFAYGEPTDLDVPYGVSWCKKPFMHRWKPERAGKQLVALQKRENFDLIFCVYGQPTGISAITYREQLGVPIVIESQGGDIYRSSKRRNIPSLWQRTEKAFRQADALVAISPYMETLTREIVPNPKRLVVIPNGIDLAAVTEGSQRPADFTTDRPFMLCLGNLGRMKGFGDAIEAYAQVREKVAPLQLLIVGKGPLEEDLRGRVAKHGLQDDIKFMGQRVGNDKRWFLQNCAFGVVASIEEGHPIVGLELLASGKPIICSHNAAFDGMYEEPRNALRVEAQQPTQLAEAMVRMAGMDLDAMGQESKRRADAYAWSVIADRYLAYFQQVIEGSR